MRRILDICRLSAIVLGGVTVCGSAFAWGSEGHRTVGAIADRLIARTRAGFELRKLLDTDLRTVSVWADCAKSVVVSLDGQPTYTAFPKRPECVDFETAEGKAEMIDFVRRNWDNCRPAPGDDPCHKQYHYTDVAIQRDAYRKNLVGTSDHDVVAAIGAAITVLQGKPAPPPFRIAGRKEALRLLTHYVGDLHQPLHVAAIYLDANGRIVDSDRAGFDPAASTRGGNSLVDGMRTLHAEWDMIPIVFSSDAFALAAAWEARRIPSVPGPLTDWPAAWATESLRAGRIAFRGLSFSPVDSQHRWAATVPRDYARTREALQRSRLIEAGAHLAQVLEAIWP